MLIPIRRYPVPLTRQIRHLGLLLTLMVLVELVNTISGRALHGLGILPRHLDSLWHIPLAPFLHANLWHLFGNLTMLTLFGLLLFQHGLARFWLVTWTVTLLGGLGVWWFGRPAYHMGSSLLIFGYFGYLLLAGLLSRELKLLLISIGIGIVYGGLLWGVLPQQHWVSFEAHLFGFLAGLISAVIMGRARP